MREYLDLILEQVKVEIRAHTKVVVFALGILVGSQIVSCQNQTKTITALERIEAALVSDDSE